ncbi:unnamed protein product, partial [Medioppia subpectinata]
SAIDGRNQCRPQDWNRWSSGNDLSANSFPISALKDEYRTSNKLLNRGFGQRANSLSISSDDTDSSSGGDIHSPIISPIGSPQKYSPIAWFESHSRDWTSFQSPLAFASDRSPTLESIARSLFDDNRQIRDSIQTEFEANGREVPFQPTNTPAVVNQMTRSLSSASIGAQPYELFGRNSFTFAQIKAKEVPNYGFKGKNKRRIKSETHCKFCKNNNETPEVYNSHVCKDPNGVTVCPVLRRYDCPNCRSGGGDTAHTIRYCPKNKEGDEKYIPSVIKVLKNGRSADGKRRFAA